MSLNLVSKMLDDFVGYNNELAKTTLGKFRKFNSIMASWAIELVNVANLKYEFHIIINGWYKHPSMGRHSRGIEYEKNLMKVVVTIDLYDP
jgi:hypothetical protein